MWDRTGTNEEVGGSYHDCSGGAARVPSTSGRAEARAPVMREQRIAAARTAPRPVRAHGSGEIELERGCGRRVCDSRAVLVVWRPIAHQWAKVSTWTAGPARTAHVWGRLGRWEGKKILRLRQRCDCVIGGLVSRAHVRPGPQQRWAGSAVGAREQRCQVQVQPPGTTAAAGLASRRRCGWPPDRYGDGRMAWHDTHGKGRRRRSTARTHCDPGSGDRGRGQIRDVKLSMPPAHTGTGGEQLRACAHRFVGSRTPYVAIGDAGYGRGVTVRGRRPRSICWASENLSLCQENWRDGP